MKYYIIAGEASGDLHAANLMEALKKQDPGAEFRCFGGDLMAAQGGVLVKHYRDMAFMGFIAVLSNLDKVLANLKLCKKDIQAYRPDVMILVDYPGFNMKIAKFAKTKLDIPVYYYISPKIWAWKEYRIKSIKRYVDKMLCILPFEVPFYKKHRYAVDYVGNPTVDELAVRPYADESFETFVRDNHLPEKPIIALLAGSRQREILHNLPGMIEAASAFKEYQLVVAGAPGIEPEFYNDVIKDHPVSVVSGKTYRLLQQSRAALVTSGTATLETAVLKVPQVVCYQMPGGKFTYMFFSRLLNVRYVSLVNLIADKEVVKELVAHLFSVRNMQAELSRLLYDPVARKQMEEGYDTVLEKLGEPGAAAHAARIIVETLSGKQGLAK